MLKIMYHMFSMVTWHDEVCKTERSGGLFWSVSLVNDTPNYAENNV